MTTSTKTAGVVTPHTPKWHQRLAARVLVTAGRAMTWTIRFAYEDRSGFFEEKSPGQAIYCVWHNRLALCLQIYHRYARPRAGTVGMAAMVSASKDGAFLAEILEGFHVHPVRGSTSRRGPQALLELTSWAERGYDLALTPDGPRGPRYIVQDGVMSLAQLTGLPVLPVSYRLSWRLRVNSWDQFQIPLPFTRCEVIFGEAIRVPRDATDAEREACRLKFENTLKSITNDGP